MTAMPMTLWTELFLQENKSADIDFAFLATRGGLFRFYDNSNPGESKTIENDLAQYGDLYKEDRYPMFYRRAASYPSGTYVYSQGAGNFRIVFNFYEHRENLENFNFLKENFDLLKIPIFQKYILIC